MKQCLKCKQDKPLDAFSLDKKRPDGRYVYCRACESDRCKKQRREYASRTTPPDPPMVKRCWDCKENKAGTEFYRAPGEKSGLMSSCKVCSKRRCAATTRRIKYGVSQDEYELLLKRQAGVCKICLCRPGDKQALAVDHCHKTGLVRGLLCLLCNTALGKFQDDPALLRRAAEYLESVLS